MLIFDMLFHCCLQVDFDRDLRSNRNKVGLMTENNRDLKHISGINKKYYRYTRINYQLPKNGKIFFKDNIFIDLGFKIEFI